MAEITASQKYSCPACGGEAQWNPSKNALVCAFCGTVSPMQPRADGGPVQEHDLATALRNVGEDQRGWDAEKKSVKCQSCQAISVFDPTRVAQRCDFCGSSALVPYEQIKAPIRPESLLEFKVSETQVREKIRDWYGSRFWAPNAMKSRALTDTVKGVYLPYWTFDAQVHADWTAEAGYHYYETESYTDAQGKRQTRQVQRTRWQWTSGAIDHFFDDELVPASKGVHANLLRAIEPFPTTSDLKPYDPAYLSGWIVEQYQIDLIAAAQQSRQTMESKIREMCASRVPGDTHRNLQVQADFSEQTFKHILMPVWLLSYNYGATSYQVVINGYTGAIAGEHPLSWVKITLAIIAALIVIAILFFFMGSH
ncbi:MAG: zinc ribbon domain-containing protein [Armatimonadota bacterium]|nr:zinc ribbon domain-containing protein [Armatimonadota bacterium]